MASSSSTSSSTSSSKRPLPTASGTPSGCKTSYLGTFPITVANSTSKRFKKRGEALIISLTHGILKDAQNRTGYIASNDQFQFDSLVPANALFAAGWAVCPDSRIYLGSESGFNECLNGDIYISSYNGSSCTPIYLETINPDGDPNSITTSSATTSATASASTGSHSPVSGAIDSGLSTGAKAGIGVGVGLGAALLAGAAWFLMRRGKKQASEAALKAAEFPGDNKTQYELAPVDVYEADGVDRPLEMESTTRAELDSDWAGWEMPVQSERSGSEGVSGDVQELVP